MDVGLDPMAVALPDGEHTYVFTGGGRRVVRR